MTPSNIVGMASLKELDVIALTDHNSCKNCPAAIAAGQEAGLTVIPGMELCTAEDIHVVCLFPSLDRAMKFDEYVYSAIPKIKNDPEVFGEQLIMDKDDNVIGHEELLLVTASNISIDNVYELVKSFGGVSFPAHIDKPAFSVISSFGQFPAEIGFDTVEISKNGDFTSLCESHPILKQKKFISNSDAHYLWDINERINSINTDDIFGTI